MEVGWSRQAHLMKEGHEHMHAPKYDTYAVYFETSSAFHSHVKTLKVQCLT